MGNLIRKLLRLGALVTAVLAIPAMATTTLVLGDSISAGYGLPQGAVWVDLLKRELSPQHPVINASISGETSRGGARRLPELLRRHQPDIVIVELGGNDALRGLPLSALHDNLILIVDRIKLAGATPIILKIPLPPNYGERYSDLFTYQFQRVQKHCDCLLIFWDFEMMEDLETLLQDDGIHPTVAAQPLLLESVLAPLKKLL